MKKNLNIEVNLRKPKEKNKRKYQNSITFAGNIYNYIYKVRITRELKKRKCKK